MQEQEDFDTSAKLFSCVRERKQVLLLASVLLRRHLLLEPTVSQVAVQ